jgi:hypothetical protein
MEPVALKREVIAEFFKNSTGKIRINNLTVLQEERSRSDGEIYVVRQMYDVDYSRAFGYIFHMSGAGGSGLIEVRGIYHVSGNPKIVEKEPQWVDARDHPPFEDQPRTQAVRKRNRTRRLAKLPKAITFRDEGDDILDWLQDNGIEGDSVWCSTCRDCFPGTDDWNLCVHCWWCDKTGDYSTPESRCDCKSREECRDDR